MINHHNEMQYVQKTQNMYKIDLDSQVAGYQCMQNSDKKIAQHMLCDVSLRHIAHEKKNVKNKQTKEIVS